MEPLAWGREDVAEFVKMVAQPGEILDGFDDRILYNDAIELARNLGDDGVILLKALEDMLGAEPELVHEQPDFRQLA